MIRAEIFRTDVILSGEIEPSKTPSGAIKKIATPTGFIVPQKKYSGILITTGKKLNAVIGKKNTATASVMEPLTPAQINEYTWIYPVQIGSTLYIYQAHTIKQNGSALEVG